MVERDGIMFLREVCGLVGIRVGLSPNSDYVILTDSAYLLLDLDCPEVWSLDVKRLREDITCRLRILERSMDNYLTELDLDDDDETT